MQIAASKPPAFKAVKELKEAVKQLQIVKRLSTPQLCLLPFAYPVLAS